VPEGTWGVHLIPDVDFERFMAVAVFRGKSVHCNGEYVVEMVEDADRMLLRYDSHTFQTAGPDGGAQHVTPYGIFIVPRSNKAVVVEENVRGLKNSPAQWKECRGRYEVALPAASYLVGSDAASPCMVTVLVPAGGGEIVVDLELIP
jgi:hypothetical protein